eukprot:CAMPEP_0115440146 /NCGR_PEP_ID=MMETSP0271-20121206/36144_1 /TAXON_ID=71861 /ORGANISM="Scrippsiella trochoidea, Strain CCMP3099" /LENGTH=124 /DNA_ID=CAMNT_0002865865 /DNA_START=255 /DNA_END=629 /DNA_ORIENTATION=-
MTNVCQYFYLHPQLHYEGFRRLAPFVLMTGATVLLLMSPLKNLAINVCLASFREHGFDPTIGHVLDIAYKPMFGERPMQAYTSLGYALMVWGTALQVDLVAKVQASVRQSYAKAAVNKAAFASS